MLRREVAVRALLPRGEGGFFPDQAPGGGDAGQLVGDHAVLGVGLQQAAVRGDRAVQAVGVGADRAEGRPGGVVLQLVERQVEVALLPGAGQGRVEAVGVGVQAVRDGHFGGQALRGADRHRVRVGEAALGDVPSGHPGLVQRESAGRPRTAPLDEGAPLRVDVQDDAAEAVEHVDRGPVAAAAVVVAADVDEVPGREPEAAAARDRVRTPLLQLAGGDQGGAGARVEDVDVGPPGGEQQELADLPVRVSRPSGYGPGSRRRASR